MAPAAATRGPRRGPDRGERPTRCAAVGHDPLGAQPAARARLPPRCARGCSLHPDPGCGGARALLLRALLQERRPRCRGLRRPVARLRGGDVRAGAGRRPDPPVHLLGIDHHPVLPAHRVFTATSLGPAVGAAGPHPHHLRRPRHARGHCDGRPDSGHVPHFGDPRGSRGSRLRRHRDRRRDRPDPRGRDHEVGARALPLLAAWCHGRTDPRQRLPPRSSHGEGRRLPRGALRPRLRRDGLLVPP